MSPLHLHRRAASPVALAALALSLLAACSGGDGGPAAVARVVLSGVVGPADSLTVGDQRTLVAATSDAKGTPLAGRTVAWSTSDAAVAAVSAAGVVSAVAPGQATITAESEGVRGQVVVSVRRRPVASVVLDRAADTVWIARTHTLRAQPRASDGSVLSDRTVTWASGDTTVATVALAADGSVVVRGVRAGSATLVARSEGASTTIPLVVIPVPISRLTIAAPDSLGVGQTTTLTATAVAADGTPVASADLAGRNVAWSSDRGDVLTVAGVADALGGATSGFTATARAVASGNATVSASIDGVAARYTILATRPRVARIVVSPSVVSMRVGATVNMVAVGLDASGQRVLAAPLVYALASGAGVLSVTRTAAPDGTPTARLDALSPGAASVAVSADGQTTTVAVTVTAAGATLVAYPTRINAAPGAQGRLSVVLTDSLGAPVTASAISYRSTNPGVATVDSTGRVTMVAAGTTSFVASAAGLTSTVPVTVTTAPTSTFHIDIQPIGTVPPAVLAAAQQAARRWERVIAKALPLERIDAAAGSCDPGTPAIHQATDGLIVFLKTANIDGPKNTLAYANPCIIRDALYGGLPVVGTMTMDSSDVAMLTGATGALAMDVLTHELGHVLGIGSLWQSGSPAGDLVRDPSGDPRFTGAAAGAAAARIGVTSNATDGVQIEDLGGFGTALTHWRERVLEGELMTGWMNPAPNPLSIVTVQSLADLGYSVTETGADIVSPVSIAGGAALFSTSPRGGPLFSRGGTSGASIPLGERVFGPRYIVKRGVLRPVGGQARR